MEYYIVNDGWFTYHVNKATGEKKFKLDENEILVNGCFDDFGR
jgi:hypothetical protein